MTRKTWTLERRIVEFWRKTKQVGECLEWTASGVNGYGRVEWEGGKPQYAHRVAFYLGHGRWPALHVLHSCDNPACVRVDHLREGTQSENLKEAAAKGRLPTIFKKGRTDGK